MARTVDGLKGLFQNARKISDQYDSGLIVDALGLNFDIGHAYCVGEDPAEWVPRMRGHTRHYHFEDIAATRVHHHLVPGEGAIDFDGVFRAIATHTPDIWVTVELYPYRSKPDDAAKAARDYLFASAARAGVGIG